MTDNPQKPPKLRRVAFFALDGVQSLDVTGPMEAFALANRFGAAYDLLLCSADDQAIRSHAGLLLGPARSFADLPADIDTLVLCGGSEAAMMQAYRDGTILQAIRDRAPRTRRVVSICTGAFVLAATGLLNGRCAATHWATAGRFRAMFPQVDLDADAIFVADPPYYSSAGVTAGIDLSLALIEADHGPRTALSIARELVLFLRRPGGQTQFSAGLDVPTKGPAPLTALAARIIADPAGQDDRMGRQIPDLAASVNMSERTFLRKFKACTGMTPARFVEEARLGRAKLLLEDTSDPLDRIAEYAGYGSVDALLRSFHKALGVTPGAYRSRFHLRDHAVPFGVSIKRAAQ